MADDSPPSSPGSTSGSISAPVFTGTTGSTPAPAPTGSTPAPAPTPSSMTGSTPAPASAGSSGSNPTPAMRTTARTLGELHSTTTLYTSDIIKTKYDTRGSKESMQWVTLVTAGCEAKLSMVGNDAAAAEAAQLAAVYDLAMRITDIKNLAKTNGLLHVFDVHSVDPLGRPLMTNARNLLDDYGTVTLEDVKTSTKAIQMWAPDHRVWVETIASTFLSNCCDGTLRERINERMMELTDYERGGATYFKVAIECITSMSHSVSMTLSMSLTTLTIKSFAGEDVGRVISYLRGASQRLKMSSMLPPHFTLIVYRIFQSSSSTPFNAFFAALYAREEADVVLFGPTKRMKAEQLFTLADTQYHTLLESGTWAVPTKKPSAFEASTDGSKPLPPWKQPPKAGAPTERSFKGRPEYWCGKPQPPLRIGRCWTELLLLRLLARTQPTHLMDLPP